jgi:hypothetical protein
MRDYLHAHLAVVVGYAAGVGTAMLIMFPIMRVWAFVLEERRRATEHVHRFFLSLGVIRSSVRTLAVGSVAAVVFLTGVVTVVWLAVSPG